MRPALVVVVVLAACTSPTAPTATMPPTAPTTVATTTAPATTIATTTTTTVVDPADYTPPPGALNPDVVQETIGTTICVAGWTATVRPSTTYTNALKVAQMLFRHLPGDTDAYEEDHFIPLELGGAPRDPANLWPEPRTGPHASAGRKDVVENRLHREVCAGTITLAEARIQVADPTLTQP